MFFLFIFLISCCMLDAMEENGSSPVGSPGHTDRASVVLANQKLYENEIKEPSSSRTVSRPKSTNFIVSPVQDKQEKEKEKKSRWRSKSVSTKTPFEHAVYAIKKQKKDLFDKAVGDVSAEQLVDEKGRTLLYEILETMVANAAQKEFYDACIKTLMDKKFIMPMVKKQGKECLELSQKNQLLKQYEASLETLLLLTKYQ